jgi:hypothetical protein
MPASSTITRKSNTAEFANLFELFDRIAARRRNKGGPSSIEDDYELVPNDMDPVVRNLASLVLPHPNSSMPAVSALRTIATRGRGRSNTVADTSKFPSNGKKYPFTFKMMLHKLYELDDWGKKVKEVLEKSQTQYRSLAEKEAEEKSAASLERKEKGKGKETGKVHFAAGSGIGGGRRPTTRGRSTSLGGAAAQKVAPVAKVSTLGEDLRAIKRRCVGRRKSTIRLVDGKTEQAEPKAAWIYESAVASVDRDSRERNDGTTRRRRISSTGVPPAAESSSMSAKRPVTGRRGRAQTVSAVWAGKSTI